MKNTKVEYELKRVCKIIWDLQDDVSLSEAEFQDLNELIEHAMGIADAEVPLSEFVEGVVL